MWGHAELNDAKLYVAVYRLFRQDSDDDRAGKRVRVMIKESIPSVPQPLSEILSSVIPTCDVGPVDSPIVFCCVYHLSNSSYRTDNALIMLLLSLFELPS